MRNLAEKGGFIWVVFVITPVATFADMIGKTIHLDSSNILGIQWLAFTLQLFSLFILIRYRREIF